MGRSVSLHSKPSLPSTISPTAVPPLPPGLDIRLLEKITRNKIPQAEVVRLFMTGQHKTLSVKFNESLASPVEAQLIRSFKVWPEDQPTFHEVKDTLLKAGLKVEDKSLRRACKRVGLDLKPSRGWRGPSGTTGVYPPTRLPSDMGTEYGIRNE